MLPTGLRGMRLSQTLRSTLRTLNARGWTAGFCTNAGALIAIAESFSLGYPNLPPGWTSRITPPDPPISYSPLSTRSDSSLVDDLKFL